MLILIVAGGPDKGRVYELSEDQSVVLGRESEQIKLNDRRMSRRHVRLWAEGGRWYVRDLGSRHGTRLNDQKLEGRGELSDGDHLQVGRTLFVLSRMSAEAAERLALLGPAQAHGATAATAGGPLGALARHPRLTATGLAAAAALAIGANTMLYVSSLEQQHVNRKLLAQVRRQQEPIHKTLANQPRNSRMLRTLLAKVNGLERRPQARKMVAKILARLDAQPGNKAVIDEVHALADASRKQQHTLARKTSQTSDLLRKTLAEVRARPDIKQINSYIQKAARARADDNARLLKQVRANLDQQQDLARKIGELRGLIAQQPERTRAALKKIAGEMKGATDDKVVAALAKLRAALPGDVATKLDRVLAKLNQAGSPKQVAAAVKGVIEQQQAPVAASLKEMNRKLDAQPTARQLLAAINHAAAGPSAKLVGQLHATMAQLQKAGPSTEEKQAAQKIRRRLTVQQTKTQTLLRSVLGEVRNRKPIQQLQAQVRQLAQSEHTPPEQSLKRILAAVKDQGDANARIARLEKTIAAWPHETEAMIKQMAAARREARSNPDDAAVNKTLKDIRARALARIDKLHRALRRDLRPRAADASASAGANHENPSGGAGTAQHRRPLNVVSRRTARKAGSSHPRAGAAARGRGHGGGTAGSVLMSPRVDETQTIRVDQNKSGRHGEHASKTPRLTATQKAYKRAFETGKPVSIGKGKVDPKTGEVSRGRTLDPTAARAAGINSWREWYLMDDFAERMRLQKKALRYSSQGDHPDLITLPPSNSRSGAGHDGAQAKR